MIAVIRIHGQVELKKELVETFNRLRLRKKLHCTFIDENDKIKIGMLKKVKDFVSYGEVDEKLLKKIIEKRGEKDSKGEYKGYCRLHPPVGGFKKSTKTNAPKGVLGKNKDIIKLLERML